MEKERTKEMLERFKGKKVLILTQKDFVYNANILEVNNNFVVFKDKFGSEVCLDIKDVKQVTSRRDVKDG